MMKAVFAVLLVSLIAASQAQTICKARTDLFIVTDGSGSIKTEGFDNTKDWLAELIEYFDFSPSSARFGLIQGSDLSRYHANLVDVETNEEVAAVVNGYTWSCPATTTAGCLCEDPMDGTPGSGCGWCTASCDYCTSGYQSWLGEALNDAGLSLSANKDRKDGRERSSCVAVFISDGFENNPWVGTSLPPSINPICPEYEDYSNEHEFGDGATQIEAATYIKEELGCTLLVVAVGPQVNQRRAVLRQLASDDPTSTSTLDDPEAYQDGKLFFNAGEFDPEELASVLPIIQREACVCTDACSGHGKCTVTGECVCDSSYYGEACENSYVPLVVGAFAALGVLGAGLLVMHRFWQVAPPPAPPVMDEPKVEAPLMIEPTMDTDANAAGAPPAMDNRPLFSPASRVTPGGVKGAAGVEAGTATYV